MIDLVRGDLLGADAEALVNTVNCVGYMGRGIAAQFKRAFPASFESYEAACERGEVVPGRVHVFETGALANPRYILHFPTKRHWRGKSRLEDIEAGLAALVAQVERLRIQSIAVPPLGCGLGGLDWGEVRPRIEAAFASLPDVRVLLYEPAGAPEAETMRRSRKVPKMTPGRAVLVALMQRYLGGVLDPSVSLLEVHKLMYFAQESGEPLKLRFEPAHYGPYAENLRHVLSAIGGYFVAGYADGGDAPDKTLQVVPGALEDALAVLAHKPETQARFDRVADVVEGFESPSGMELLATVHWVATRKGARDLAALTSEVHSWNLRKRAFTQRQIGVAYDMLRQKGWVAGAGGDAAQ